MDLVVDGAREVKKNVDVGAKRAEHWVNNKFAKALGSPSKPRISSSSCESIYELDSDKNDDDSLGENLDNEYQSDHRDVNGELSVNNETQNLDQNGVEDFSDSAEMEEVFVIVDDEDEVQEEKNDSLGKQSEAKERLRDCEGMNGISNESLVEKKEVAVPQLSDDEGEIESALADFAVTDSNEEKKSDPNILLSDDEDDGMDGLLEEFREEETSGESSPLVKNETEAASLQNQNADTSMGNDFKTTKFPVLKSLPTDKDSNTVKPVKSPLVNASSNKVNNAIKSDSDCIIMCANDEKSNASDTSSIEILDDDSQTKSSVQNTSRNVMETISFKRLNSPLKSPSFSSSSEDKFEFDSIILDIVDEATKENEKEKDVSELKSKFNSLSENNASEMSKSPISEGFSEKMSNVNNSTCSAENSNKISELSCSNLSQNVQSTINDTSVSVTTNSDINMSPKPELSNEIPETLSEKNQEISIASTSSTEIKMDTSFCTDAAPVTNSKVDQTTEESNTDELIASHIQDESSVSSCKEDENKDKVVTPDISSKEQTIESEEKDVEPVIEDCKSTSEVACTNQSNIDCKSDNKTCSLTENEDDINEAKLESKTTNESKETKSEVKFEVAEMKEESESRSFPIKVDNDFKTDEHSTTKAEEKFSTDNSVSFSSGCEIPNNVLKFTIKRKIEDDDDIDFSLKKLKEDIDLKLEEPLLNGERSFSDSSSDFDLKTDSIKDECVDETKSVDKISSFMSYKDSDVKIRASLKTLDRVAVSLTRDVVKANYKTEYLQAENMVQMLEDQLKRLNNKYETTRLQIAEVKENQKVAFSEHNFKQKVTTRTVGVNVKIYRDSEIKNAIPLQNIAKPNNVHSVESSNSVKLENPVLIPKTESPVSSTVKPVQSSPPVVTSVHMKDTVITPVLSNQQVNIRKQLIPRIIAQPPGRPPLGSQVISMQGRVPAPNVTVSGNHFISVGRPPTTHGVVLLPSSTVTSSRNQFIDLTKEEQRLQKSTPPGISTSTTSMTKVNMPRMPGNPNVLVPLKDYLQLLPPGSKGTAIVQSANMPRPTIIPPLPSSLVGARTVTYIVPPNSGLGTRGIQPFLQSSNQQVQFLLRVTNAGTASSISPVINTMSKPTMLQPPLATAPRPHIASTAPRLQISGAIPRPQIPAATAPRLQTALTTIPKAQQPQVTSTPHSSGIVMISPHMSKHPAPFPKSPHYPDKKGKALPPKPSLKGSKNSNGIVLSWNMCLYPHHAIIASYQLFAYQETDGPVDASLWKKVGDVNALPLPMACTLTQFVDKNRYYFTVRAVDTFQRFGPFSDPVSVLFERENESAKK